MDDKMWICDCNVEIKRARVDVLPKTAKSVTEQIVYDDHSHGFDRQKFGALWFVCRGQTVN